VNDLKNGVYLAGGVRTAIGSFCGVFHSVPAPVLGSVAARAALARSGVPREQVDEVIFGNVISAGLGQNPARQVSIGAGLGVSVGATTINKVCGSGLKAVILAAQSIQCGDSGVVLAGGTENMSRAPYLLERARVGYRMGNGELVDAMIRDGLWDVYNDLHMGACGDLCAEKYHFSREEQDEFAIASFKRAREATAKGIFAKEIEPVEIKAGKEAIKVTEDENLKKFDEEKLRRLRPAFGEKGTVTAGNASSINDGAAAILALSAEKIRELGVTPQARILGYATFAGEPEWFTTAPAGALTKLLKGLSLQVKDVDLFEINEAFSVVPMVAMKELGIPHEKINVHGGAIALGHPIGASGARTLVTLISGLQHRGGKIGVDALCLGGGEAVAMAIEIV
jgi:acetyl-CoA C-acetyltransferase